MEFPWWEENLSTADSLLGPPILIAKEMVVKSNCKMKNGNASGPSGVVMEMLKVSYNICCELIADLTNSIVCENMMPSEGDGSFLLSSFNGNGETIDRIYCHSLKLTEHVLNVVKQIIEVIISMWWMLMTCSLDLCLYVVQLTPFLFYNKFRKNTSERINLYFAFVDLEKALAGFPERP